MGLTGSWLSSSSSLLYGRALSRPPSRRCSTQGMDWASRIRTLLESSARPLKKTSRCDPHTTAAPCVRGFRRAGLPRDLNALWCAGLGQGGGRRSAGWSDWAMVGGPEAGHRGGGRRRRLARAAARRSGELRHGQRCGPGGVLPSSGAAVRCSSLCAGSRMIAVLPSCLKHMCRPDGATSMEC